MLVLTRKQNEKIEIILDDNTSIMISIAEIDRNRVKIGFDAPKNIKILRTELKKLPTQ